MKTSEQLTMRDEITELLMQMNERQLSKAARFTELFIKQGMTFEAAVTIVESEFSKA